MVCKLCCLFTTTVLAIMKPLRSSLLIVSAFWLLPVALAQYNFFEQMFGHGQQQQQRGSGVSQWASQADAGKHVPAFTFLSIVLIRSPTQCSVMTTFVRQHLFA